MLVLYGDLSAAKRMSRFGLATRAGPNSGSSSASSASIGDLTSSSYWLRWASNQALLLFTFRPRKKPLKSPFHPANRSAIGPRLSGSGPRPHVFVEVIASMPVFEMPLDQLKVYGGRNPRPSDFDAYWERALRERSEERRV